MDMNLRNEIIRMRLEGNSKLDIMGILDIDEFTVDLAEMVWEDMTDDEREAWKLGTLNY